MNYVYLFSAIMILSVMDADAMERNLPKSPVSKGIPILPRSPSCVQEFLRHDADTRKEDYLMLKCAFASFVEGVNRKLGQLEVSGNGLRVLDDLKDDIDASKLFLKQCSGGCPITPPPSLTDESPLSQMENKNTTS